MSEILSISTREFFKFLDNQKKNEWTSLQQIYKIYIVQREMNTSSRKFVFEFFFSI